MLGNHFKSMFALPDRFASYISISTTKNVLEREEAPSKWCTCKNAAFLKLPTFAYQL